MRGKGEVLKYKKNMTVKRGKEESFSGKDRIEGRKLMRKEK